jgi:hypothetical protein
MHPIQDDFLNKKYRFVSLGRLIEKAIEAELLNHDEGHMIREWMMIRIGQYIWAKE